MTKQRSSRPPRAAPRPLLYPCPRAFARRGARVAAVGVRSGPTLGYLRPPRSVPHGARPGAMGGGSGRCGPVRWSRKPRVAKRVQTGRARLPGVGGTPLRTEAVRERERGSLLAQGPSHARRQRVEQVPERRPRAGEDQRLGRHARLPPAPVGARERDRVEPGARAGHQHRLAARPQGLDAPARDRDRRRARRPDLSHRGRGEGGLARTPAEGGGVSRAGAHWRTVNERGAETVGARARLAPDHLRRPKAAHGRQTGELP